MEMKTNEMIKNCIGAIIAIIIVVAVMVPIFSGF